MQKGRWVTLGSRSRGRRQRRKKDTSPQPEQDESSSHPQKSKQSANTPPPVACPPREGKLSGNPTFKKVEKEINKVFNCALEDEANRALEPVAKQVDPALNHRSSVAVKTMDYPKNSFWKKDKTQDSATSNKKDTQTEQTSCGSSDVSDSTSDSTSQEVKNNKSIHNNKKRTSPEKIKINWIFDQKPTSSRKEEARITSTSTTPNAKQELRSWPKIKKAASMPNLNPNAPSFLNPYANSFKSFTPRLPTTAPWQHVSHQSMITPWRTQYPVFNSYSHLPHQQFLHNNGNCNDNRESVSNLLLPYSCGPY